VSSAQIIASADEKDVYLQNNGGVPLSLNTKLVITVGGQDFFVTAKDCVIDSNDDPIVVKSHSEDMCRDVLVRNCELATFERGVKVGNESLGPFVNIRFEDIIIRESDFFLNLAPQTAIYLSIADGGSADSIYFERIQVNTDYDTPIFIRLFNRYYIMHTLISPITIRIRNI
jgi:hypothetical protein